MGYICSEHMAELEVQTFNERDGDLAQIQERLFPQWFRERVSSIPINKEI